MHSINLASSVYSYFFDNDSDQLFSEINILWTIIRFFSCFRCVQMIMVKNDVSGSMDWIYTGFFVLFVIVYFMSVYWPVHSENGDSFS